MLGWPYRNRPRVARTAVDRPRSNRITSLSMLVVMTFMKMMPRADMTHAQMTRQCPRLSYVWPPSWAKMKGGLEMRMTPAATTLYTPHRSRKKQVESIITITGLEDRMVVESPRGSRAKLVNLKNTLRPPETACLRINLRSADPSNVLQ